MRDCSCRRNKSLGIGENSSRGCWIEILHLMARHPWGVMLQWGMHYFAYGSNLNLPCLREHIISHGVDTGALGLPRRAILQGYRLRANYVSCVHRAAACNIEPSEGGVVEGLVMKISPAIRGVLRIKEGWPQRYEEVVVEVLTCDRREPLRALTYIVCPEHRLDVDMAVTARYRRLVLDGARAAGLSNSYRKHLERMLRTTDSSLNMVRHVAL